ncbi:hypothetical protein ANN_01483 [Periplaneta americana]|uniref:Uncharacterized protein n=1 Tax=Periplaneta americana TaxID=6978 RepID=A0ABQ8TW40_PERAM|nr:hypothetical protein ANN_01483 [Periplaneta americana]
MERVKWTDRIRHEAVLERVGEKIMMLELIRKEKRNWLGEWLRRNCLLKDAIEGMVNGKISASNASSSGKPQQEQEMGSISIRQRNRSTPTEKRMSNSIPDIDRSRPFRETSPSPKCVYVRIVKVSWIGVLCSAVKYFIFKTLVAGLLLHFYIYDETKGGKGSNEVVSFLLHYIDNVMFKDVRELHLHSDSCGGQNRNGTILGTSKRNVTLLQTGPYRNELKPNDAKVCEESENNRRVTGKRRVADHRLPDKN